MGASGCGRAAGGQGNAAPGAGPLAALALWLAACAAPGPAPGPDEATLAARLAAHPPEPGAVVVRLAFGGEADFDLYVTGPLEETVYFANTPTRIGGRLLADLRCDAPEPRIETVVFAEAPPGRYRVGVDLPERCDGRRGEAAFAVELRAGERRVEADGRLAPGRFEPIVLEWIHGP